MDADAISPMSYAGIAPVLHWMGFEGTIRQVGPRGEPGLTYGGMRDEL